MTGLVLATHEDLRFKSEKKRPSLQSLEFIGFGKGPELDRQLMLTEKISEGVILTRELVNSPANVLTPGMYSRHSQNIISNAQVFEFQFPPYFQ
jgi:leucyl aminopeptidase